MGAERTPVQQVSSVSQQPQQLQPQQWQGEGHDSTQRLPVFLLGHSMGGLVAALACLRRQDQLAGLLLHSPALDVEWTPVLRWVCK